MISASDRQHAVTLIDEAIANGARKASACQEVGISSRTHQRWTQDGGIKEDARPTAVRPSPRNKLSAEERAEILHIANSPAYRSLPPSQIVPALADQGNYIASESSFYRVLREADQQHHRGRSQAPTRRALSTHKASSPNQVWCWDITWLPGPVKGVYYYLYLILDLYSRKIVGWEIHEHETSELAAKLVTKAYLSEGIQGKPLVLHSDNGSPMKGSALLDTLYRLGVVDSYSRPRVSNDNAYAESLFRTCKYRPEYPVKGFINLDAARSWVHQFVQWYNHKHKHSGLKFITPSARHTGQDKKLIAKRQAVYASAKARHPERWTGETRNWTLPEVVWLNPDKDVMGTKQVA
jgi:putative transposase